MLVGGDLGFFSNLVVAAVVLVLGLVGRVKWRRSVARREEIKRLCVMASEEAARAELEALSSAATYSYGYDYSGGHSLFPEAATEEVVVESVLVPPVSVSSKEVAAPEVAAPVGGGRPVQYKCEVCFCPTTTRCARCKAVRYCSGKCQIIHWRQGHRDECRPFAITDQKNDTGGASNSMAFKPETFSNTEPSGIHQTEQAERSYGRAAVSNSLPSEASSGKGGIEVDHSLDQKRSMNSDVLSDPSDHRISTSSLSDESSVDASASDPNNSNNPGIPQSINGHIDKPQAACGEKVQVKLPTAPRKSDESRPVPANGSSHCAPSTTSGWGVHGSSELSRSELSTPASGFWEGALKSSGSKNVQPIVDTAKSCSNEVDGACTLDFRSFSCSSPELARNIEKSSSKNVVNDVSDPPISSIRKSFDQPGLSKDIDMDGLKSKRSQALRSETSSQADVKYFNSNGASMSSEARYSSSSGSSTQQASKIEGPLSCRDALKANSQPSSCPVTSNVAATRISSTVHTHLSSSSGRNTTHSLKPLKSDSVSDDAAHSSEYTENPKHGLKTSVRKVVDQLRSSKLARHNSLGAGSELWGKCYSKGIFPYELFVKLYNLKVDLRPCGLINCGNSCYANAVLQCLTFTPPLTAYFVQGWHSKSCKKQDWCFTCEFESLVLKMKDGHSPLSPIRITSQLQNIGTNLNNGREEDAHEFLRYAIDTMQSVCLREAGVKTSGCLEEETSLIGLTFGGYLRSKIECMRCGGKSERHERMMDLTVEIDGDIGTLEEALRQFTHTETLDGENKYHCGRCKSYEKARKKLKVLEAPNVLTIALKRFQSGKFGKLNKTIKFPEILNLAPYMSGTSDKSPIYQLYGVIVHLDLMNAAFSGHYVCYVKNIQNKWFKIDDSSVKSVDVNRVLTKGAYMLLYARCSPRAPKLIRSSVVPSDARRSKQTVCKSRFHSRGSWDASACDSLKDQTCSGCSYPNRAYFQSTQTICEEDSSSDNSSSFFSEIGSSSTDSSNRDSSSMDEFLDQILFDTGGSWNSPWRNSSDSDTSSSSSSPSPLYSRHSPLADSERYASGYQGMSGSSNMGNAESAIDGHGFWGRPPGSTGKAEVSEGKESAPFLCPDSTNQSRKLGSCSSSRATDSSRLGWFDSFDSIKTGVPFRRPTRERAD